MTTPLFFRLVHVHNVVICNLSCLTTFNKIAIQGKCPDGKWTRKPLAYQESNIFHLCVTRPDEICVNFVIRSTTPCCVSVFVTLSLVVFQSLSSCLLLCSSLYGPVSCVPVFVTLSIIVFQSLSPCFLCSIFCHPVHCCVPVFDTLSLVFQSL